MTDLRPHGDRFRHVTVTPDRDGNFNHVSQFYRRSKCCETELVKVREKILWVSKTSGIGLK